MLDRRDRFRYRGSVKDSGSGNDRGSDRDSIRNRNQDRPGPREGSDPRGAGHAIVPDHPTGNAMRPAQWRCRAPPGGTIWSSVQVEKQAAGAPSAGSQPPNLPPTRPRRWDAGPLGRQSVTAAQKAGTERTCPRGSGRDSGRNQRQESAAEASDERSKRPPGPDVSWSPPGRS